MARFLQFITEETPGGCAALIKEYVIGTEVYRKPSSYDPRLDATVRVEASKLRQRLNQYYDGAGREDAIRLSVPKGAYVVQITSAGASSVPNRNHLPSSSYRS